MAHHAGQGLRFHDLRHSCATWLVDDEVPSNMVHWVMGHEHVSTRPCSSTFVTEHHDRIRQALNTAIVESEDPGDPGTTGAPVPNRMMTDVP